MEPLYFILMALAVIGFGLVALVYFGFIRPRDIKKPRKKPKDSQQQEESPPPAESAAPPAGAEAPGKVAARRPFDILRGSASADAPTSEADAPTGATESAAPPPPPAEAPQGPRPRILIAALLREEVSGNLIVKVGNREYLSPQELLNSPDQRKVEYAAADLQQWFGPRMPEPSKTAEPEEAPSNPRTMVEQINQILARKILNLPQEKRAIRLVEGPDGNVRVYLGLRVYALSEVPDEEVKRLIRESVSEWESRS